MSMTRIRWAFSLGISLLITISAFTPVRAHDKTWPAKRLSRTWSGAEKFTSKEFALSGAQVAEIEELGIEVGVEDKNLTLYFAQVKQDGSDELSTAGAILFVDEYGNNGLMEVSVGVDVDGRVSKLHLWEHSENKAINSDDFLEQFHGMKLSDSFEAGIGYKPANGAAKASAGVARAVHKALASIAAIYGTADAASGDDHDDSDGHHDDDDDDGHHGDGVGSGTELEG